MNRNGPPQEAVPTRSIQGESLHNIIVATVKSYTPVQRIGPSGHTLCGLPRSRTVLVYAIMPVFRPLASLSIGWGGEGCRLGLLCDCVHCGRLNTPSLEESVASVLSSVTFHGHGLKNAAVSGVSWSWCILHREGEAMWRHRVIRPHPFRGLVLMPVGGCTGSHDWNEHM